MEKMINEIQNVGDPGSKAKTKRAIIATKNI